MRLSQVVTARRTVYPHQDIGVVGGQCSSQAHQAHPPTSSDPCSGAAATTYYYKQCQCAMQQLTQLNTQWLRVDSLSACW